MTFTKRISQAGGSGSGEALDKRPSSGPPESAPGARSFSGPLCASCPAPLAPGDGHLACFRCLGADHAAAAMAAPVSCVACRELPEEGILSRHLFFSPAVDLADAIHLFRDGPDLDEHDGIIDADDDTSMDDVFGDSASGFSHSRVTTATVVQRGKPCRMADLFWRSWGECFRTPSSSRRATQGPLFPPVQHLFTAAGGDPSTLKAPSLPWQRFCVRAPDGALTKSRCMPPDRLQRQIVGGAFYHRGWTTR
ncbi:unnamed protein product [Boreogadus saida]